MSFVADFASDLFGGGDAGEQAGNVQGAANQQAIEELRRQFGITQENLQPFVTAGQGALSDVVSGSTLGGLGENIANIFDSDLFASISDKTQGTLQNLLAKMGLSRSGSGLKQGADADIDIASTIENLLFGRSANLAGSGQNAASGLGALGDSTSQGIASLFQNTGATEASGLLQDQQSKRNLFGDLLGAGATVGSAFFKSDSRLKTNIVPVGNIGDLPIYQWDWIDEVKDTVIGVMPTMGFMAKEVKKLYPEYVHNDLGFDEVDYGSLLNRLELENGPVGMEVA